MSENIFLVGFSATGKSSVGRQLAHRLNLGYLDTDDEIVARTGRSIPDIFSEEGEEGFRAREREVLEEVCRKKGVVVSTGGGVVLDPANRTLMMRSGAVICLEAKPATIHQRLLRHASGRRHKSVRPLLAGHDPLKRIESLKEYRQPFYAMADWTVHTDDLTIQEVMEEAIRGLRYARRRLSQKADSQPLFPPANSAGQESVAPYCQEMGAAFVVSTPTDQYPVFVGWGILDELGRRMRNLGLSGTAVVIVDDRLGPLYGPRTLKSLKAAGFEALSYAVSSGEGSKSRDVLSGIYDWLVEHRIERGHAIVALGGGMIGDLAGYAAATYLRGVPLVQVPTTLVAMTDSSIGGKVAINHPLGKNLIGAFYQPRMVLADVQTLSTLPPRELASGWAEVIKHGIIMDSGLVDLLERDSELIMTLEPDVVTEVVKRSAALKGQVVGQDEKEAGLRMILNYGHTIGHSLEAVTEYRQFLHGEAVSIGMVGAAWISQQMVDLPSELGERQRLLLQKYHLPISLPDIDVDRLIAAMQLDKKVKKQALRWVLVQDIGRPVVRDDVPLEMVRDALAQLLESG